MLRTDFELFYLEHFHKVRVYCFAYLRNMQAAYDTAQDSFAAFMRYTTDGIPEGALPLVFRIARNKCLNLLRNEQYKQKYRETLAKRVRKEQENHNALDPLSAIMSYNAENLLSQEVFDIIAGVFAGLPEGFEQTFRLSVEQELDYKKIAVIQGISEKTVAYRLKRVKDMLKEALREYW